MNPPPRPLSHSPTNNNNTTNAEDAQTDTENPPQPTLKQRAQIKTHHCRFCSHLLLATTQDLDRLPRRREPAGDRAIILPLPEGGGEDDDEEEEDEDEDEGGEEGEGEGSGERPTSKKKDENKKQPGKEESQAQKQLNLLRKHYTILLSTTLPDRRHTVIRREDGFEKRLLLRCGRCRVVVGYVLDEEAHRIRPGTTTTGEKDADQDKEGKRKVVYILPGSLVGTDEMGDDLKVEKEEWAKWIKR
ncbi:hypothetical protein FQN54_003016 [Arachnomyces sp. PD_36]|nr:hypothetical protein FQN54_003016 [Arachnomyces sp. PD_36]